jgi:hypothetical protein
MTLFESLYRSFEQAARQTGPRPVASRKGREAQGKRKEDAGRRKGDGGKRK